MVEGLDVGVGYYEQETDGTVSTGNYGQDEGTAYIKYSTGPVSLGYRMGTYEDGSDNSNAHEMEAYSIAFNVNDELSLSHDRLAQSQQLFQEMHKAQGKQ